jgi:hypothetical protein
MVPKADEPGPPELDNPPIQERRPHQPKHETVTATLRTNGSGEIESGEDDAEVHTLRALACGKGGGDV